MKKILKQIYDKLFRINDSPQKIALGLGLGVFSGIFPGTGPLAALALAFLFRANRASALLGSISTNTWLSVVTFLLSIKTGSVIMQVSWQEVYKDWSVYLTDFKFANLFKLSLIKILLPVFVGYIVVALTLGLMVYLITLVILSNIRHENKNRA